MTPKNHSGSKGVAPRKDTMFRRYKYNVPTSKKVAWAVFITAIAITSVTIGILLKPVVSDDSCDQCGKPSGFYVDFESDGYTDYLSIEKVDPNAMAIVQDLSVYNEAFGCAGCQESVERPFSKSLLLLSSGTFALSFPGEDKSTIAGLKVSFDVIVPPTGHDFSITIGDGENGIVVKLIGGFWVIETTESGEVFDDTPFKTNMAILGSPNGQGVNTFSFTFSSGNTFSAFYNGESLTGMHTGGENSWTMQSVPERFLS